MKNEKVWMITGAGRGMGVEIAKAAMAAGFNVIGQAETPIRWRKFLANPKISWL